MFGQGYSALGFEAEFRPQPGSQNRKGEPAKSQSQIVKPLQVMDRRYRQPFREAVCALCEGERGAARLKLRAVEQEANTANATQYWTFPVDIRVQPGASRDRIRIGACVVERSDGAGRHSRGARRLSGAGRPGEVLFYISARSIRTPSSMRPISRRRAGSIRDRRSMSIGAGSMSTDIASRSILSSA